MLPLLIAILWRVVKSWLSNLLNCQNTKNMLVAKSRIPKLKRLFNFFLERKDEEVTMTSQLVQYVKTLWTDPAIQYTYTLRSRFQLNDSAQYFFDKIDEVAEPGYIPSEQDLLHARIRTTGIIENDFVIEKNRFKMIDVGGQRNERKKWIHCFEGVTAVLFVVDIAAYDRVLYEDEKVNRLIESLNLFENICNSRWFRDTSIILFLNKSDIFKDKIKEVPLSTLFADYTGGSEFETATAFIEQEFTKRNHFKKPVYCHVTCATNTQNVSIVFNGVKDIVVREALVRAGLV